MQWDKSSFCEMETFVAPKNMFWTPDIGIIERYKKIYFCQNLLIWLFVLLVIVHKGCRMMDRIRVMAYENDKTDSEALFTAQKFAFFLQLQSLRLIVYIIIL